MALDDRRNGSPESERIDTRDPAYRAFVDCFARGAALQDIDVDTDHGFAARRREPPAATLDETGHESAAAREFGWVFLHRRNLARPLAAQYGLRGKRVLDFGCGTGGLSVALALEGAEVVGVDPTPVSLQALRHRARYFGLDDAQCRPLQVAAQPGLPFVERSFDLVVTNSVIEFIPEQRARYVAELVRVTRAGGHVVISTENGWFPRDYYSGMWLPRLRRRAARRRNLPFGASWLEVRRWALAAGRRVRDTSARNRFNSLDKLAERQRRSGHAALARSFELAGGVLKAACRALRVPADLLLPYATYVFVVED